MSNEGKSISYIERQLERSKSTISEEIKKLIENCNKILRQFLPKGMNFDLVSDVEIHKIQDKINRRSMKALGWLSLVQCFNRSFGLLV